MAKYEVLSGFCLAPGRDVSPGEVIEMDPKLARYEVEVTRRLAPAKGAAPAASAPEPAETETETEAATEGNAATVENADPKPARRAR